MVFYNDLWMCKMNLSRLREANRRQTQIICSICFGCFVFKEVSHEWQSLANRRDGGRHFFHLFSWPLMLFPRGCLPLGQQYPSLNRKSDLGFRFLISPEFRAEKRKKHVRTLRECGAPRGSKMVAILIFLFSTIYYATADIPVSSDNYPIQEDSCRCNLAVVRFSYGFLNFKKDFKALDVPAACKQIASTGLLLSWTFLQKATI